MSGYNCRNKFVFSFRRHTVNDETDVMPSGRLFHSSGPAEPNDPSPTVTRRDERTVCWLKVNDWSRPRDDLLVLLFVNKIIQSIQHHNFNLLLIEKVLRLFVIFQLHPMPHIPYALLLTMYRRLTSFDIRRLESKIAPQQNIEPLTMVAVWLNVTDGLNQRNLLTLWKAGLVLGWVTLAGSIRVCIILILNQPPRSTQPGHPFAGRCSEYRRKLGSKQAPARYPSLCWGL